MSLSNDSNVKLSQCKCARSFEQKLGKIKFIAWKTSSISFIVKFCLFNSFTRKINQFCRDIGGKMFNHAQEIGLFSLLCTACVRLRVIHCNFWFYNLSAALQSLQIFYRVTQTQIMGVQRTVKYRWVSPKVFIGTCWITQPKCHLALIYSQLYHITC